MINGTAAIILNVSAIALITFVVSNLAVSAIVCRLAQKFTHLEVSSRKSTLWLLTLIPWLAVACVVVCYTYKLNMYSDSLNTYAHWHHMNSFALLSWHFVTLMIAMGFVFYVLATKLLRLYSHRRELSLLRSLSNQIDSDVYEINTDKAGAFTSGFVRKYCYLTSGILANTSEQEQQVILTHERAHAKANDPLKKWIFSILAAFFLPSVATRLKLHMTLAMEQMADRAVINQQTPATFVASTLVKVAKLNRGGLPIAQGDLVSNFGADILEQRIYFLLGQLNLKPANQWVTLGFVVLILAVSLLSIDGIHHLMETVFSH